jgi:hypothetical protein
MEIDMNALIHKPAKIAVTAALLAGVFFALPVKMDAQHPLGFSAALAGSRHDSANPRTNNTDNRDADQLADYSNGHSTLGQTAQSNGN